nr:hypothetical protein [Opitutaceae bacterium]
MLIRRAVRYPKTFLLPLCATALSTVQLSTLLGQSLYFDPNGNELSGSGVEEGQTYDWSEASSFWSTSSFGTSFDANTGWQNGASAVFSASSATAPFSVQVALTGIHVARLEVANGNLTIAAGGGGISTSSSTFITNVAGGYALNWSDGLTSMPTNAVLEKQGAGTLVLGALAPTTITLRLGNGILRTSANSALATTAPLRVEGNYRLELSGTTQSIGTLATSASGGPVNLVDLGGGSLTVRQWESGTVQLGTEGTFTVSDPNATLGTNRTLSSGRTEGAGTFIKDDAGTLVLGTSAGLAHSGDVEVRGGTLAISTSNYGIAQNYA